MIDFTGITFLQPYLTPGLVTHRSELALSRRTVEIIVFFSVVALLRWHYLSVIVRLPLTFGWLRFMIDQYRSVVEYLLVNR